MRLFVGIALSGELTANLKRVCDCLRHAGDGLRWPAPESWHITLQFLGNADPAQFDCLQAKLFQVRSSPVPLHLGAPSVFDRAGAFVVDVELTPQLAELQRRVVEATQKCSFVPEERPYHPHITLARAKGDKRPLRSLKDHAKGLPALPAFTATEFLLYESHLGPGGAKYEVRARFALSESESCLSATTRGASS